MIYLNTIFEYFDESDSETVLFSDFSVCFSTYGMPDVSFGKNDIDVIKHTLDIAFMNRLNYRIMFIRNFCPNIS